MTPLISSPNRGYGDYQRTDNADSGVIWASDTALRATGQTSPILDVGRFEYLGGSLSCQVPNAVVQFHWYMDAAATISAGSRFITLDPNIGNPAQTRIINLGPFLIVTVTLHNPGFNSVDVKVWGSTRYFPLECVPQVGVLIDMDAVPMPAGNSVFWPSDYYSGPLHVASFSPSVNYAWVIRYATPAVVYSICDGSPTIATQQWYQAESVVPLTSWHVLVVNSGAPSTIYFKATASMTGAI